MTREQVEWLRTHAQHTIVGCPATGVTYMGQGYLQPNGSFIPLPLQTPVDQNAVHVGVKQFTPPAGAPVAREYNER